MTWLSFEDWVADARAVDLVALADLFRPSRRRRLVAALVAAWPEPVGDALVTDLWSTGPAPASVERAINGAMSTTRQALRPHGWTIVRVAGGWKLVETGRVG